MYSGRTHFQAMGCLNELHIQAADQPAAQQAMQAAMQEVQRIEHKYSRYRSDSLLSRINAAAGNGVWLECDEETRWLLGVADLLFRQSDGLFDITCGVLRRAWDFSQPRLPQPDELEPLLALIGWAQVERSASAIRLPLAGMQIDFGGFAKEYAADRAALVLQQQGICHGYVNLGGDIRVLGPQADGQPWLIGIHDPRRSGQVIATLPVERGALATSGDYERFFELDGRRYCHILDPRSGQPVHGWRSITVLAPLCIAAGSCTTIAMLKEAQALQYLQDTGFSYLAVDHQGQPHTNQP